MSTCMHCTSVSKYKCPICQQPYCSVACYKLHKINPCVVPNTPNIEIPVERRHEYEYSTEDTVPFDKLQLLEQSMDVRTCLENPHVREILLLLDKSLCPDELIQDYMQEPIFTEFVDACLKVVQTTNDENT